MKYFLLIVEAAAADPSRPIVASTRLMLTPKSEKYLNEMVMMLITKKNDALPSKCLFCISILA